ncbi:cytochrome c1 [Thauera linaloolentis]|uniref:Cytochrome C1 n=1 Tax=Thauera linaloolentis (strain DSM 12138 / JCM 21573 / CCUG 41526 / CIP 105981 / IAM 15112 / NBRC 102519 / 47Lol) TaxID=1123367 RepID=N6YFP6_THAL4|nr:cytochrome c1 [Thauera linaloolentis]ENO90325.1 cytochrome C1 [Thauera linaloolentis 47Lol = DSM 12138]MCM8564102.1 cytochrome c1 [Thauera linaloolentis]
MKMRVINLIKRAAAVLLFAPALALAADASVNLDKAPVSTEPAALQHGAKLFVNYCLNCHGASYVRYNQLENIGLSEQMIRDNLLFTGEKVGDLMKIAMQREDGKAWFGAAPPDLSVIARSRASGDGSGADWLYTYLRQFYRDTERPTGWNNVIFENVGMPHVLWELQGEQVAKVTQNANGSKHVELSLAKPGKLSVEEYDKAVADLVSFLVWMGEPVAEKRKAIGTVVLIFLAGFFVLAYALKKNYWKDIH